LILVLSKTLDLLLAPLTWALLFMLASLVLWRRARWAAVFLGAAMATLLAFSSGTVADRLIHHAEAKARSTYRADVTYDAVIVLGGLVDGAASRATGTAQLTDPVERITRAYELLQAGQAKNALLSGGFINARPEDRSEAEWLAMKLREWGIAPDRIAVEGQSLNTHENAVHSALVAREKGWTKLLLVTSAAHMPRALGCFHRAGLFPDALPVDFRSGDEREAGWQPRASALAKSTEAIREMAGRVVYRVLGYSE